MSFMAKSVLFRATLVVLGSQLSFSGYVGPTEWLTGPS